MVKTVVIIDDDADDLALFTDCLKAIAKDIQYWTFDDPIDAIGYFSSGAQSPDLLIMDYNMPKFNGIECLREISRTQDLTSTVAVIFSSPAQLDDLKSIHDLGARYVQKPLSFSKLKSEIRALLLN